MAAFPMFMSLNAQKILRRIIKGMAYLLGGLSVLLIIIMISAGFYIRSDAGERRLLDTLEPMINNALTPLGLSINIESLGGPLPSHFVLHGIRVTDRHGVWLSVKKASLDVQWSALWNKTLRVNSMTLDRPELVRLPIMPPSANSMEPEQPAMLDVSTWLDLSKIWPTWLPALDLDRLSIDDLVLEQAVAGQRLVLTLEGAAKASASEADARLKVWNSMPTANAPGHMTATMIGDAAGNATELSLIENADFASLNVTLTPEQTLNVRFVLENFFLPDLEPTWGMIPGVQFHLEGAGPLTTWKGAWQAELRDGGMATNLSPGTSPGANNKAPVVAALNGSIAWTLDTPSLLLTVDASTAQAPKSLWELIGQHDGQAHAHLRLMLTSDETHQAAPASRMVTASLHETMPPLNVTLESSVQLTRMKWGTPALHALFGPNMELTNHLNISRTTDGQTDLTLSDLRLASSNLTIAGSATAKASLPFSDKISHEGNSGAAPWLSTLLRSGDMAAKFSATLTNLTAFTPDAPTSITAESPLTIDVALSGPLHAPYAAVNLSAANIFVASALAPQISAETTTAAKPSTMTGLTIDELKGQLKFPRIALVDLWPPLKEFLPAPLIEQPNRTAQSTLVSGTLNVHASRVNRVKLAWQDAIPKVDAVLASAGDILIQGNLAAGWEPSGQLRLDVSQLMAQGAGVQVNGNLGGLLPMALPVTLSRITPPQKGSPQALPPQTPLALQGELQANVTDWKQLSALAGYAIEGTGLAAHIRLESPGHTQNLIAEWQAASLVVKSTTPTHSSSTTAATGSAGTAEAAPLLSITEWQGHAMLSGLEAIFAPPHSEIPFERNPGVSMVLEKITLDASNKTGRLLVADALLAATSLTVSGPLNGPIRLQASIQDRREVRAKQPPDPNRPKRVPRVPSDETPTLDLELEALTRRLARNITGNLEAVWRPGLLEIAELRVGTSSRRNPVGVNLSAPASVRYGISPDMPQGGLAIKRMELAVAPTGHIVLEGTLNPQKWQFDADIRDLDLTLFQGMLTAMPSGQVQAKASLRGNMQRPAGDLSIQLNNFQIPGSLMPPASVLLIGTLENSARGSQFKASLALPDKERAAFGVNEAVATLRVPLFIGPDGLPRPAPNLPLNGDVIWRGALAPLWNFLPVADKRLLGEINLDAQLSGTLQNPHLAVNAAIRNAEYQDLSLGLLLKNIQASLNVQETQRIPASGKIPASTKGLASMHASADDGMGGTLSLDGSLDLAAMLVSAKGSMTNLKPLRRQDLRIDLSGTASVEGALIHPTVTADITVNEGELTLENLPGGNIRTLPISNAPAQTVANDATLSETPAPEFGGTLHINIHIPNRFFARGHGLDSEWRGDFDVNGPIFTPSLAGSLSAVRGNLDFLGRNFKLSRGVVTFAGGTQINPMLDIIMTYQASSITADIGISGLATRPKLSLSSQPSLPQDEILAQIMFGQSADKLGRLEALQLASAVASLANLSSGSGFGVLGTARKIFGVDVLRLNSGQSSSDSDDLGGAELEVGKYITDKVYVGVSQGISGDASTGVVVEIELTPRINAEARAGTTRTEVGVEWKYDY